MDPPSTIKEMLLDKQETNIFIFIQFSGTTQRYLFIYLYFSWKGISFI